MSTNPGLRSVHPLSPLLSLSDIDIRQSASPAIFIAYFNTFLKITRSLPHLATFNTMEYGIEGRRLQTPISSVGQRPVVFICCRCCFFVEKLRRIASVISKASGIKLLSLELAPGRIMRHDDKNERNCRT